MVAAVLLVNNSGLNKDTYTKFYEKMHHGYTEMTK